MRTPELHDYYCSLLNGPLQSFNSTTYGVNYDSILNKIPLFNVADWQLPQDVMHILLEGVLPLEIKLLLHHFTSVMKFLTIDHFNMRLDSFVFGYDSKKPSKIDSNHLTDGNLRQSGKLQLILRILFQFILASQCWSLGRYLPLIIGDLVPTDDPHWECFLYLHDILAICLAPCISSATIAYLSQLISSHHVIFKECYPHATITPKLHYMVHFPEQIRRYVMLSFLIRI